MSTTGQLLTEQSNRPHTIQETLNTQLVELDKLLADPKYDHSRILEQALRVLQCMSRLLGNTERKYILDNEPVLFAKAKELKETYNTWSVLALTVVSATITVGGGIAGMGAAIPGTALGLKAASTAPNMLGWLANADYAKQLANVGQGMSSAGQGIGSFSSLLNNTNEAKRTVYQLELEEIKRKRSDREAAARQMTDQMHSAANTCRQTMQSVHTAAQQILSSRG